MLYEKVKATDDQEKKLKLHLITPTSTNFSSGIIITTVHLSKGLEFDEVLVPFVSASNYKSEIDRRMLYIACTRAMHRLTVTYEKGRSGFFE